MNGLTFVPIEVGICIDGYGFMGVLDLRTQRSLYGVPEYFGLTKDRKSACYIADYYTNENTKGTMFALKKVDEIHPAGLYYFSRDASFDKITDPEAYLLFVDPETYCRLEISSSSSSLPEIRTGKKREGVYYEVVKAPVK